MSELTIWQHRDAAPQGLRARVGWLTQAGAVVTEPPRELAGALVPWRRGVVVGLLLVAPTRSVACNGGRCPAGVQPLRHGDRLNVGATELWISGDVEPEPVAYDAAVHGSDQFCLRTKARLLTGESVVVCPGTAGAWCGMLYKAAAFALHLRCHACGRDPRAPRWRPPAAKPDRLRDILARLTRADGSGPLGEGDGDGC